MIKRYKQTQIDEIVKILKSDGVISVPTDTVYGICARISTQKAHDKLIAIKNRPEEIIEKVKSPLFMTSANISGQPTCNNLDEIENVCPLLDGMLEGKIIFSKGSTIVDCTSNEIKILRSGPISYEEILKVLNK